MKKLLIFLMALVTLAVTTPAFAAKRSIMELPLFERAVLIIKKFETLHQLKHRPYYGYGHRILPGERFPQHRPLTESEADALLRKDLKKFCAMYSQYGKDSVLLGALAYNIGSGAVNKSSVIKKLKAGDRNIFKSYTSHCRYKGKWHKGLYNRRLTEIAALFVP
ncbi:glycoside hydrolase family protein [Muribaculum intestinale]|uniref:glycoside hydrolase family protein n=1 Tax=Muribaculum intestinale TaxID=1796646 RepID=UPI0025AFD63E|nr:glycoside hydrolase family protein [Muribaculum intestinale]